MQVLKKYFVSAIALLAVACGEASIPSTPVLHEGEGLLELPLVATTTAGRSYKLVGASFAITGPQSITITDTSADTVSVPLLAGLYTVQMTGSWHVERTDAPGQTVPATLVSPNPMSFTVGEGQTRPVRFLFKVAGDATADVGFSVDHGGWISGSIEFELMGGPQDPSIFAALGGTTVPFVISFASSTVTRLPGPYEKRVEVVTGPVTLQFGGTASDVLQNRVVPALEGLPLVLRLTRTPFNSEVEIDYIRLESLETGTQFGLLPEPVDGAGDSEGYPTLQPFVLDGHFDIMRNGPERSDTAFGRVHGQIAPQ
ncbi:hypothetical protein [Corallococcus terminator]|uniref:Lipoprotein n=1 Tax=Corallococcus terminator TaxID=2316733 RepID=A0A3A8I2S7_9BACT|nr:hypothetical protein [Corallococcus terminator]RKG71893.1 hypothetical protein D7V88_38990 [Corallococcus terminator]